MTAMSILKGNTLTQVKRLTGGKDVVDVAAWAHRVAKKYPGVRNLHFQPHPKAEGNDVDALNLSNCPDNHCLVNALKHFYSRVTKSQPKHDLKYPDKLQFTDADAIKYMINLLGDMHQPLHLGNHHDAFGGAINLTLSVPGSNIQTNLFALWDTELIKKFANDRQSYWYGGWTHVNTLGKDFYEREKSSWEKRPWNETFETWARENREIAVHRIYQNPMTGKALESGLVLSGPLEYMWIEEIKRRILRAGVRTAIVLNAVLENRDGTRLRQGSGVVLPDEDKVHVRVEKKKTPWLQNLLANLGIIAVVLVGFLYISRFFSSGAPRMRTKEGPD
eukprot:GHVU01042386.1.p1 GENE.GHVU01042386.1~~GHVU01042386.1.p1  ORF type:complete len:347 (-),score=25.21 GHVU01042386.1:1062-2060(-)